MSYFYADIKLGYDCNNDCIHCVIADQRRRAKELRGNENRTTEEYKLEILDSVSKGVKSVTITGGEPTIRTDLKEILSFAKSKDLRVLIQSNGRAFASKNYLNKVCDYIDFYMIALHGSTKEIHDKITRSNSSFEQVISGLKNLNEINANIGIKVVISKFNCRDLLNILKLVKSLNINYVNFAFPHANGNALEFFDEVVPRYSDIKLEIENLIKFAKENNLELEFEQILPCALDNDFDLKFFSDIKFRNNSSKGELKQLDGDSVDWNTVRVQSKRKGNICSVCVYNKFCEGFWIEYVEKFGFSEFRPVKKLPKEILELVINNLKKFN